MLKKNYIFFDFSGTLVKMRPATLLVKRKLLVQLNKKLSLGIITGARRTETINILDKLGILNLFQILVTADDSKFRKPSPRLFPQVTILYYVGDTKKDDLFAKSKNIPFFRVNKKYNVNQIIRKLI